MIGETVGNYRITKLLGEGGMGVVYQAEHPGIGRKAAIKMLHPSLATSPEIVTRFFNEARAANAVRHPGIVEVFDFGTLPSGATYIIMEFLEGLSLSARIKGAGRLTVAEAVDLAHQTADVLGAAHGRGIVHRDLKPDNIFVVPDLRTPGRETIKVLDFGIAKLGLDAAGSGSVRTRTGTVMGTPLYMSPEQCLGTREVDHRTDVYALGVILYEMLCGRTPFVSQGHGELIHMHIAVAPPPPRSFNPAVPKDLEDVVLKALVKDPALRIQTMRELQEALRSGSSRAAAPAPEGAAMAPTVAPPSGPPQPTQTTFSAVASMIDEPLTAAPRKSRRGVWAAAVLGVAAVSGAAVLTTAKTSVVEPTRVAPTATPVPAEPPPSPIAARPEPARAPKTVSVSITSEPAGARLVRERDGAAIGVTPFKEDWPSGDGVEKLQLELDGYRPRPFVVPLDRGLTLSFGLTKIPAAPTHKKRPHESVGRAGPSPAPPRPEPAAPSLPASKPAPKLEPVPL